MGKIWPLVLAVLILGLFGGVSRAQSPQNFIIHSFSADYYLDRNAAKTSTLHAVESIQAEFPSYNQNHGILRAIPQTYQDHTVSLQIARVTDENETPIHYETNTQNDNLVLKIGDADNYVHGLKTYIITYDARNVISNLPNQDEFYWDVNGDQWQQPFGTVTARLHTASGLNNYVLDKTVCYVGASGSSNSSRCSITTPQPDGEGKLITSQADNLGSGENLTMVAAFAPGTFKLGPEIAQAERARLIKIVLYGAAVLALPMITAIYAYSRWRKYGRDPKGRGVIIPEYQPPKGLNVLTSDFVFRESMNNKAISALILELSIRKYITIYETTQKKKLQKDTTSYSLKLIKDPASLTEEEKDVVNMFFGDKAGVGTEVNLADLRNKLSSKTSSLKSKLGKNLLAAGYFSNNPNSAGTGYYVVGAILALSGFFFLLFVFPPAGISVGLSGLILLLAARYMPARSQKGVEVSDYMLGLRDYIKLAEADRLKFLQSPQGAEKIEESGLNPKDPKFKIKLFESLLPYAMLFNLEKQWSKQFENVYLEPPDWYSGNWTTFNTAYLASSLSSFNSASAVTYTSPSSSGSSGFSGGSSGGGGGGGGGGGW
ncbi:DUF2207 domain-containing protein [Candidatus Saccharibacteria bacterium]|nr:DUF2207 domain-containing protein [Candidatus Saccharibacteria bacterium]